MSPVASAIFVSHGMVCRHKTNKHVELGAVAGIPAAMIQIAAAFFLLTLLGPLLNQSQAFVNFFDCSMNMPWLKPIPFSNSIEAKKQRHLLLIE